jgi:hypothetical protein
MVFSAKTANPAQLAENICPQKAIVKIKFLAYFCNPLIKYRLKKLHRLFWVFQYSRNTPLGPRFKISSIEKGVGLLGGAL